MSEQGAMDESHSPFATSFFGKYKREKRTTVECAAGQLRGFTYLISAQAPVFNPKLGTKHSMRLTTT
jgi:hypothetical protein